MIVYQTSSPTGDYDGKYTCEGIDNRNNFKDRLLKDYHPGNILMITACPDDYSRNDQMIEFFSNAFKISGFKYGRFDLWDHRHTYSKSEVQSYSLIILGGGHVPTQDAFFKEVMLKEKLQGYNGIVMGISAGSMSMETIIYCQPEEAGESDLTFERFRAGLGLTDVQVCPHYQVIKDYYLDGKHLYNEIVLVDSYHHTFYAIEDGSYIRTENNESIIYGRSYEISEGKLRQVCENDSQYLIKK